MSDVEHAELEALSRGTGRAAMRARLVLLLGQGKSAHEVADELHLTAHTVYKWRRRFVARGLPGLSDLARSGQPRRLSAAQRAELARVTRDELPPVERRWTIRTLARSAGVTQHQVRSVWSEAELGGQDLSPRLDRGLWGLFIQPPVCALVLGGGALETSEVGAGRSAVGSPLRAIYRQTRRCTTPTELVEAGANLLAFLVATQDQTGDGMPLEVLFSSATVFAIPGLAHGALEHRGLAAATLPRVDLWIEHVEARLRAQAAEATETEASTQLTAAVVRYLESGATHAPFAWVRGRDRVLDLRSVAQLTQGVGRSGRGAAIHA